MWSGWEAIAGRATGIWGIRSHVRGSWARRVPEANELLWEELLERGFRAAGQTEARARDQKKSKQWKIWVATEMKRQTNAPNAWIARWLHMGVPHTVTIHVRAFECGKNKHPGDHEKFIERFTK